MLLAKEFVRSARSRSADFTTSSSDSPLVIQFAANNATDFARAAEMAMPYCDGVNLNCGCPQPWAIHDGVGCAMMKKPRDVADMVRAVKDRCGAEFCVSVKIRIHKDLEETERFVRMVEEAGVDYITVHGRMRQTRSSEPVNLDAIKRIVACARVPVLANGDVFTLEDAHRISGFTGAVGVMAGRGLLLNPALFAGFAKTPWGAVERWLELCARENVKFEIVLWQLGEMLDGLVRKKERSRMGEECRSWVQLLEWLDERFVVRRSGEDGFGMGVEVERREAEVEA